MTVRLALVGFALIGAAPARAQTDSLPAGVTTEMVEAGEAIFAGDGNCWACHGQDATGARGVGPDLTDDAWWHSDGSYEAIVRQILTGVSRDRARNAFGAEMPPRGGSRITDEQVRAVAAYVWSLRLRSKQREGGSGPAMIEAMPNHAFHHRAHSTPSTMPSRPRIQ